MRRLKTRSAKAMHEPLSKELARILQGNGGTTILTANQLIERTGGRGLYFVLIILSLPFVAWVSVPGMSTVLGPIIGLLGLRLALGKSPRLPARLGDRELPPKLKKIMLGGGLKFCRFLEKGVRPRRTAWMTWRAVRVAHALLIVAMAVLLALPLPSPPFLGSNALPSYAIILLAVSMMEEDGVMIWFAYAAALVAAAYFALWGGLIATQLSRWLDALLRLLEVAQ
jgi:hypothetical protein